MIARLRNRSACYYIFTSHQRQSQLNSRWNWREAVLGKIDRDYRESFLREDKSQARILIAIAAVWAIGYIYVEYLDLNIVPLFYMLLALRFFFFQRFHLAFLKITQNTQLRHGRPGNPWLVYRKRAINFYQ